MLIDGNKLLVNADGSALDRISGFETEYAINCETTGKLCTPVAASEYVAFHGLPTSAFDEQGARVYLDGTHPEYSSPEEVSYLDSAYRGLLGHVAMASFYRDYSAEVADEMGITATHLFANTCDITGNSWSSHENILARRGLNPQDYIAALAAHNLSRIVWSGAGHVVPRSADDGFRFCLSERAEHIWDLANYQTTRFRPLVNLKDETLGNEALYRRIHGVSGETVFSPTVNALRQATTSIILRACELGIKFDDLLPEEPVQAIRDISHDPSLKQAVRVESGSEYTGIEMQLKLAERAVDAAVNANYITPQEKFYAEKWAGLCEDLRRDPESCVNRVDWILKKKTVEHALEAKQERGHKYSAFEVARFVSIEYHRLLPKEGLGMQAIRKGFFEDSPSAEVLQEGLPLPPTRAFLRADTIRRLRKAHVPYMADWWFMRIGDQEEFHRVNMARPHDSESERMERALERVAA